MPDTVRHGNGTEFWLHDGTALVELAEIIDVPEFPGGERALIETTHMKTGSFKTYISTPRKDGRETTIAMNLIPGSASDLLCKAAFEAGDQRQFKIVYLTGATPSIRRQKTGPLVVRNYMESNPKEDRRTAELTVKWAGDVTDAPATP